MNSWLRGGIKNDALGSDQEEATGPVAMPDVPEPIKDVEAQATDNIALHDTNELTIRLPALQRLTLEELQAKVSWIKSVERDTSPTGPGDFMLATLLRSGEKSIPGQEYERRVAPHNEQLLGYQHAQWLVEHQDECAELLALLDKVLIDCSGLVLVSSAGCRYVPRLFSDGTRWNIGWHSLAYDFGSRERTASFGTQ